MNKKSYRCTDLGNSYRLRDQFNDVIRFVPGWGWLVWNGAKWELDTTGRMYELATRTIRTIATEAGRGDHEVVHRELASWARQSESKGRLEAMISLAGKLPELAASADDFD